MKKFFIRPLHTSAGSTECSALEVDARFSYPCMLFFYSGKLDATKLRATLARVLDDFAQYAGKFDATLVRLQIHHGQAPVVFEETQEEMSLQQAMAESRAGRSKQLEPGISLLRVWLAREAGLVVRFTQLSDGCVLSVGWNHAIGDMHSTMLLLQAWAAAYSGKLHEKPLHVTDRDAYFRATLPNTGMARAAAGRADVKSALVARYRLLRSGTRVGIGYSFAELSALRHALSLRESVTLNDALCAHICSVLRELSGATNPTRLCLVVNYRKRLGLPEQLVGNMTTLVCQTIDELDSPAQIAAGLRQSLRDYATKHVNYHATLRVYRATQQAHERMRLVSRQFDPGSGDVFVTNWNNFGMYELAFDEHKPELCQPATLGLQLPQWFMIVHELPNCEGLHVTVGLPRTLAERWCSAEGQALLRNPELFRERPEPPRWPEAARARVTTRERMQTL